MAKITKRIDGTRLLETDIDGKLRIEEYKVEHLIAALIKKGIILESDL